MFAAALLLLASSAAAADSVASPLALSAADVGNWTVGDCILAQFAMTFTVHPNVTKFNETLVLDVPADALVDQSQSQCGQDTQLLNLDWTETSQNGTELARNITIKFTRVNETAATPSYGVGRVYGSFDLARFSQWDPKLNKTSNITSYVDVDTGDSADKVQFRVPTGRSFLCQDTGAFKLQTHLHYTFEGAPKQGTLLPNATLVDAKHVQLDAFRDKDAPKHGFQTPLDCDYQPSDIVPIAVGVALATLVVIVLIAYMVGRRKQRQRGYQSV